MSFRAFVVILAGLVCLSCGRGCSGDEDRDDPTKPAGKDAGVAPRTDPGLRVQHTQIERTYETFGAPVKVPRQSPVRLIDAGKGPRRRYRYEPHRGASEKAAEVSAGRAQEFIVTTRVTSRDLRAGEWGPRIELPEIRYGLGLRVGPPPAGATAKPEPRPKADKKLASGMTVHIRGLVPTVGAPSQSDPALAKHVERLASDFLARYRQYVERKRVTLAVSERGIPGALAVSPDLAGKPEGESTRHEILHLVYVGVIPFPDAAIGAGARWQVTTTLRRGLGVVTQTATYQLAGADKDGLRIAAEIKQVGEHQLVSAPGLQGPTGVELVGLFWLARGEVVVKPDSLTPASGAYDVELRVHTRLTQPGSNRDFFVESVGKVTLETRPAE